MSDESLKRTSRNSLTMALGIISAMEVPSRKKPKPSGDKLPRNVDQERIEKRRLHQERTAKSKQVTERSNK